MSGVEGLVGDGRSLLAAAHFIPLLHPDPGHVIESQLVGLHRHDNARLLIWAVNNLPELLDHLEATRDTPTPPRFRRALARLRDRAGRSVRRTGRSHRDRRAHCAVAEPEWIRQ